MAKYLLFCVWANLNGVKLCVFVKLGKTKRDKSNHVYSNYTDRTFFPHDLLWIKFYQFLS